MKRAPIVNRTLLSMVGMATAVTTTAATWAPVTAAAPTADLRDAAVSSPGAEAADGTYESCAAYFGYGKNEYGVLDIVDFDVADENGSDGVAHAVGTDTQVVLELTNEDGDTLECTPVEVTESMWNTAMDDISDNLLPIPASNPLPAWPGPGHYIYPSVNYEPEIDDFGTVTGVGFKVTSIPGGHTLVSPSGVQPLDVHYPFGWAIQSDAIDPLVESYITSAVGADAASAFRTALSCGGVSSDQVEALKDALALLLVYRGKDPARAEGMSCGVMMDLNVEVSFLLDQADTVNYTEPITLSVAETSTTTTTTTPPSSTTTPAEQQQAGAATPVKANPTYTG